MCKMTNFHTRKHTHMNTAHSHAWAGTVALFVLHPPTYAITLWIIQNVIVISNTTGSTHFIHVTKNYILLQMSGWERVLMWPPQAFQEAVHIPPVPPALGVWTSWDDWYANHLIDLVSLCEGHTMSEMPPGGKQRWHTHTHREDRGSPQFSLCEYYKRTTWILGIAQQKGCTQINKL
jgi:hypothetical protein